MRIIAQRVAEAKVEVEDKTTGKISSGLLLLLGFEEADTPEDLTWLAAKISKLRIFQDDNDLMNLSVTDVNGEILAVSQFTLFASTKKGNRPSFITAAKPEIAIPLYEKFLALLEKEIGKKIETGIFGANMKVSLVNDGPVTIFIDSKNRE